MSLFDLEKQPTEQVLCDLVWFSVVCVVWCGSENRGLSESAHHKSSRTSVWGDRHQIAVRVWWDGWFVVGGWYMVVWWWCGVVWCGVV